MGTTTKTLYETDFVEWTARTGMLPRAFRESTARRWKLALIEINMTDQASEEASEEVDT